MLLQVPDRANVSHDTSVEDWSSYDENERIKIHNGRLNGNQITLAPGKGIQYDYENGQRKYETRIMPDSSVAKVEIDTDADGLYVRTNLPSTGLNLSRSQLQNNDQYTRETIPQGHTCDNHLLFDENAQVVGSDFYDDGTLLDSSTYSDFCTAGLPPLNISRFILTFFK